MYWRFAFRLVRRWYGGLVGPMYLFLYLEGVSRSVQCARLLTCDLYSYTTVTPSVPSAIGLEALLLFAWLSVMGRLYIITQSFTVPCPPSAR